MKRLFVVIGLTSTLLVGGASAQSTSTPAEAEAEATISAYQTEVADLQEKVDKLQTSVAKRDVKIDEQRARISELKEEVNDLEEQLPPTSTPTPVLSGKDAYPYVGDALDVFTRPFNHIGERMSFCGVVQFIQVARPGNSLYPGDTVIQGWSTVAQVFVDGVDAQFMLGFDGDSSGIYEQSYVCVWGTLIDTSSGTNTFGGTIVNPLFDAEYFELA